MAGVINTHRQIKGKLTICVALGRPSTKITHLSLQTSEMCSNTDIFFFYIGHTAQKQVALTT